MVKLVILLQPGPAARPECNTFLMQLEALPGLRRKAVNQVFGAAGVPSPFSVAVEAYFSDRAAMQAALTSPQGTEAGNLLREFAGPGAVSLFMDVMEEEVQA